ncbi:MAG: lysophospholipid acyltransferase family protein [Bacteroidota bacterium]|nr:lysophospholipid acyltransferase family protein [Bacteroidota bacterium]
MYYFIVTIFVWLVFLVTSVIFFPIACLIWLTTQLFDRRLTFLHYVSCFWASIYTWANPLWKVKIEGREKIDPDQTYVMVCNHQSMADILVLYRLFIHYKWVSKAEMFKIPIVGWNMWLNRYVALDRGSRSSHMKMIKECAKNLSMGNSLMIFPEGTRSEDGKIHKFKEGAFAVAKIGKSDILPIVLNGSSDALPKKGFILKKKQTIHVKILDPVSYESFAKNSVHELSEKIYKLMNEEFKQIKHKK